MTPVPPSSGLLADPSARGVLLMASRDPDCKVTFLQTGPATARSGGGLVCKVATTEVARAAVRREAQALVALRRMPLGRIAGTIPRYVSSGADLLVSTQVPGEPMSLDYHRWRHTAGARSVARDLDLALGWLEDLWAETATHAAPLDWAAEVAEELERRWDGSELAAPALERLWTAHDALAGHTCPRTTVHGDYWFGNVLLRDGAVSGVVDWEAGEPDGWPLRDAARFLLSYSLYLDRHTRHGRPVPGHRGLRRGDNGDAVAFALLGRGWYPQLVRARLARALRTLDLPGHLWYAVALTGIGEVAATANHEDFGRDHLRLLASLPVRPSRPRRLR